MKIAARSSPLSKAQVVEVIEALKACGVETASIKPVWLTSTGDKDLLSSLKDRDQDDFFTKEIDECVLNGHADVAVHSAKDLPKHLDERLEIVALTKGVESSDVLLMKEGFTLNTLPVHAKIGSSSHRRDEVICALRPDLVTVDLRGSVDQRVEKVLKGPLDGAIIAKAALIRLGLTHLNIMELPGETTKHQGQLAMVARKDHERVRSMFAPLDTRAEHKKVVYFGLKPLGELFYTHHIPLIQTHPLSLPKLEKSALRHYQDYTHLLFTSKQGVHYFFKALKHYGLDKGLFSNKTFIAVGEATANSLKNEGIEHILTPKQETQEGISSLLTALPLRRSFLLIAGAEKMRRHLTHFLSLQGARFQKISLYKTLPTSPDLSLLDEGFDEYVFSSPSQVEAYAKMGRAWPNPEKVRAIGPVTQRKLNFYL